MLRLYLCVMGSRSCRHACDHLPAALSAPAISRGMSEASGRFRQYLFGISACIAFDLQARRIEDVFDNRSATILRRRLPLAHRACRHRGKRRAFRRIPMRATLGCQDRPAHAGEAADEEPCIALDDEMLRLEPGDIMLVAVRRRFCGSGRRRASCGCRDGPPSPLPRIAARPDRMRSSADSAPRAAATAAGRAGRSAHGSVWQKTVSARLDEAREKRVSWLPAGNSSATSVRRELIRQPR